MKEQEETQKTASWFSAVSIQKLDMVLKEAMQNVERGLSGMLGCSVNISTPRLETVPIAQLATHAGDPEAETVGVYLLINGDLQGQAILLMPLANAFSLVAMLQGVPASSITTLGELEEATLAELGNLMVSYFLNAMATLLGRPEPVYPSPPAVMVDMLGAILNVVATPIAIGSDDLLIVTCDLQAKGSPSGGNDKEGKTTQVIPIHFWVMPTRLGETESGGVRGT